jgi:PPOX class probable F420-dependent enzyme
MSALAARLDEGSTCDHAEHVLVVVQLERRVAVGESVEARGIVRHITQLGIFLLPPRERGFVRLLRLALPSLFEETHSVRSIALAVNDQQREFLESHRLAVIAVQGDRDLSLTPVYYALDGDDLIISTTATRLKGKAVPKHPDVVVCVLHEEFPFPYLTVYGKGRIENEGAAAAMARIGEKMFGASIAEDAMPALEKRAKDEKRVVLRVTPERFSVRPG